MRLRAARWAAFLHRRGVRAGDRVGIVGEKQVAHVTAFFAIFSTGAIAVPVAEDLPEAEMGFIFADAAPVLILCSPALAARVKAAAGAAPVVVFQEVGDDGEPAFEVGPAQAGDTACLIYTSGSTGRPKGVMLTHRNLLANSVSSAELIAAGSGDVVLSVLPYWHSFALTVEMFTLLVAGGVVAIPRDKRDFARSMGDYRPTIVLLVPRIVAVLRQTLEQHIGALRGVKRALVARALRNASDVCGDGPTEHGTFGARCMRRLYLRTVLAPFRTHFGGRLGFFVSGGAPLDKDHQVFFKRLGIPIYQGYGLTESSPVVSAGDHHAHRLGSSGRMASWLDPACGGDYTFEDAQGRRGKDVKGQLLLKGDCVMRGYWQRDEETARAFRNGWLYTGDMGCVDGDGYLYLFGRNTNLICLVGGEKFHPEPVEERLKSSPLIAECVVFGEGLKHSYALIAPHEEHAGAMAPAELRHLAGDAMRALLADAPAHCRPRDFAFVPPFTLEDGLLTSTMKVKRQAVLARYADVIEGLCVRNGETRSGADRP